MLGSGQRQRVLIAGALAQRTPYLLLDEPPTTWTCVTNTDAATLRGTAGRPPAPLALHDLTSPPRCATGSRRSPRARGADTPRLTTPYRTPRARLRRAAPPITRPDTGTPHLLFPIDRRGPRRTPRSAPHGVERARRHGVPKTRSPAPARWRAAPHGGEGARGMGRRRRRPAAHPEAAGDPPRRAPAAGLVASLLLTGCARRSRGYAASGADKTIDNRGRSSTYPRPDKAVAYADRAEKMFRSGSR
ncbi:hypothetical protein QJS66_07000 [Kocuria rhizophila]|nr:hypothetical protein QJS66_07000 [Kocuria rhizophila]